MLARLDKEMAPLRATVDREGKLLRLRGPLQGKDAAGMVHRTLGDLGYSAEPLGDAPSVSRWFGTADIDELSQEEALVLAERWITELSTQIDEPQRLLEPLRITLLETFRAAAHTGDIQEPNIEDAALRTVLDESELRRVQAWLRRKLGRADPE